MDRSEWVDPSVSLPPGLSLGAIRRAVEYIERELAELVDIYYEQMNVFSAIVGIYGTKALDSVSNYEKHRNVDTAQQRFPDLRRRGYGSDPTPNHSLENKASKRPWALQSHFNHAGWYIVWRYLIDPTETLEAGKQVIVWRVDVAFLESSDWKYESSGAGPSQGGPNPYFWSVPSCNKVEGIGRV